MSDESEEMVMDQVSDDEDTDYEDDWKSDRDESNGTEIEEEEESKMEDQITNQRLDWNQIFTPQVGIFNARRNPIRESFGVEEDSTAFEILKKFITTEMIEDVIRESNRYVEQVRRTKPRTFQNWVAFDVPEFWKYIGISLMMGIVKKPSLRDYWSTDPLIATPFFGQMMSRNRYLDISRSLHFVNNENVPAGNTDRFYKLGRFMPTILDIFKSAIHHGQTLCIDETLLAFSGRLSFKQFNPMKRARFGMKLLVLADCDTGIVTDILPYQGKATRILDRSWIREVGFGGAAVLTLLQEHLNQNHRIVIDNWFDGPKLARRLLNAGTYVLGTVQNRR